MTLRPRLWILLGALIGTGVLAQAGRNTDFPHERHEGLFPLCQSCHAGIESTSAGPVYPSPGDCARCHDGSTESRAEVGWTGPSPVPTNLDFSHDAHRQAVDAEGDDVDCAACHRAPGAQEIMAVVRAAPESCLTCHAHEASEHLDPSRDCARCHRPITDSDAISLERLAAFPSPASHSAPDYASQHAPTLLETRQNCATCHAEESCTRCHLNGARLEAVRALESDARVALLEAGRSPAYPTPDTHYGPEWSWLHGSASSSSDAGCDNCHASDGCLTCHTTSIPAISALPTVEPGDRRGARMEGAAEIHEVGFAASHEARAAADPVGCATCHTDDFCTSCHAGSAAPSFHFANYLQQHATDAWGGEAECSTCHNTDVFCRTCHEAVGRGSLGRLQVAYHSRRPFWLFGHGTAARQGLESCRGCHSQADCMVCHAAVGSWRVNPHGPGFPADRLRDANIWSCLACHRTGIPR